MIELSVSRNRGDVMARSRPNLWSPSGLACEAGAGRPGSRPYRRRAGRPATPARPIAPRDRPTVTLTGTTGWTSYTRWSAARISTEPAPRPIVTVRSDGTLTMRRCDSFANLDVPGVGVGHLDPLRSWTPEVADRQRAPPEHGDLDAVGAAHDLLQVERRSSGGGSPIAGLVPVSRAVPSARIQAAAVPCATAGMRGKARSAHVAIPVRPSRRSAVTRPSAARPRFPGRPAHLPPSRARQCALRAAWRADGPGDGPR